MFLLFASCVSTGSAILPGDNPKIAWAEFTTLSSAVFSP
jgi:hypothetical protein